MTEDEVLVGGKIRFQGKELTVLRIISRKEYTWTPVSGNIQKLYEFTVDTEDGVKVIG